MEEVNDRTEPVPETLPFTRLAGLPSDSATAREGNGKQEGNSQQTSDCEHEVITSLSSQGNRGGAHSSRSRQGRGGSSGFDQRSQGGRRSHRIKNHKVINRQITSKADMGHLGQLFDVIEMHLPDMNGLNIATAFHRVAKLSSSTEADAEQKLRTLTNNQVFKQLYEKVVEHITHHSLVVRAGPDVAPSVQRPSGWEMPVQCMSIITWSCATLRLREKLLFTTIAGIVTPRLHDFQSFELSNLLWAYAKMQLVPPDLFDMVGDRLQRRKRDEFKAQCLSMIAWAFTTAERRDPAVFSMLANEIKRNAKSFKPQEISNTLWAFAKIRCVDTELFTALGNTAIMNFKIWQFKSQELSNTVWAFATVCLQHPQLFATVEDAAIKNCHEMSPQNVANILWSYAKLRVQSQPNGYLLLIDVAAPNLHSYKRQELSTVIWAASQVCPGYGKFFTMAAQACCQRLKEFSPLALANLMQDLSAVDTESPEPFQVIMHECLSRLPLYEPVQLCMTLRSMIAASQNPTLRMTDSQHKWNTALNNLCTHLAPRINRLRASELQSIIESLWMLELPHGSGVEGLKHLVKKALADQEQDLQSDSNSISGCKYNPDQSRTKLSVSAPSFSSASMHAIVAPQQGKSCVSQSGSTTWPSAIFLPEESWSSTWCDKRSGEQSVDNMWSLEDDDDHEFTGFPTCSENAPGLTTALARDRSAVSGDGDGYQALGVMNTAAYSSSLAQDSDEWINSILEWVPQTAGENGNANAATLVDDERTLVVETLATSSTNTTNRGKHEGKDSVENTQDHAKSGKDHGISYTGSSLDGKARGKGNLKNIGGGVREEEWPEISMFGACSNKAGTHDTGQWVADEKSGHGYHCWPDFSTYEGQFLCGRKHGNGAYKESSGDLIYEGQWVNDTPHGFGRYNYKDGRTYNGQWQKGIWHGEGNMNWPDGSKYTGGFEMGKRSGDGCLVWADGRKYNGQWALSRQHGIGESTAANGVVKKYKWENGKVVSEIGKKVAPASVEEASSV